MTSEEDDLKKFHLILQNVLLNWDKIERDADYEPIIDPNRNSMYQKFRLMNPEENDKMVKARCMAFTIYILSCMC